MARGTPATPGYIAQLILAYLLDHTEAQDTLEGIIQWWLTEPDIEITSVQEAIDFLVEEGVVLATRHADARVHYRINPDGMIRIRQLIAQRFGQA